MNPPKAPPVPAPIPSGVLGAAAVVTACPKRFNIAFCATVISAAPAACVTPIIRAFAIPNAKTAPNTSAIFGANFHKRVPSSSISASNTSGKASPRDFIMGAKNVAPRPLAALTAASGFFMKSTRDFRPFARVSPIIFMTPAMIALSVMINFFAPSRNFFPAGELLSNISKNFFLMLL